MSTDAPVDRPSAPQPTHRLSAVDREINYRPIARSAVVTCLLGMMSVIAFLDPSLAVIPAVGILAGTWSLWRIRARSEDYTGEGLALTGLVLCAVCWAGGWGWWGYIRLTEVPEGHLVINYDLLQPDPEQPEAVPESAKSLEGQPVFVKGYMYPGRQSQGIREFILCYSNDECCFGGSPKLTHMIRVTLDEPQQVNFSRRVRKVAGVFHVKPTGPLDGLSGALYHIDASSVQ